MVGFIVLGSFSVIGSLMLPLVFFIAKRKKNTTYDFNNWKLILLKLKN